MAIDPIVEQRMFLNMFICMKCNARNRVAASKVRIGKALCRKCGYKKLRPRKKGKSAGKA